MRRRQPGRPLRRGCRRARVAAVLLLAPMAAVAAPSTAGDGIRTTPVLEWLETWTSNATGANDGSHVGADLLTSLAPRLLLAAQGARGDVRADLGVRLTSFARHSAPSQLERLVDASAHVEPLPGRLALDAAADARRVDQSLLSAPAAAGPSGNPAQSQVRSWRVAPRLENRLGDLAMNSLRLEHSDFASDAGGGVFDTRSDSLDERFSSGSRFHELAGSLQLYHRRFDFRAAPGVSETHLLASGDLRLGGALHAIADLGRESYALPTAISRMDGPQWRAGLRWQPSLLDSAEVTGGHRFYGPAWGVDLTHHGHLGFLALQYREDVSTIQSNFQLPAGSDAVAFLSALLAPSVTDPSQRSELARSLAGQLHLTGALAAPEGFVTTTTFLDRHLDLRAGYQSPRSTVMVSGFSDGRTNLAGLQQVSIGDFATSHSIHTSGFGLSAALHPGVRTLVGAGLQASRAEFDDIGRTDHQLTLSAGASRTLDRDSSVDLQLLRLMRDSNAAGNGYHESALRVSFVHRF